MNSQLTTFYIVRHGESEANVKEEKREEYQTPGEYGPPLTKNGKQQVSLLAKKLKNIHFDVVFSSDLLRAKETAEILTLERKIAIQTTHIIRERNFASYHGKWHIVKKEVLREIAKLIEEEKMKYKFADLETEEDAVNRLITFVRELAVAYSGKTVLIASHGTIMRMFLIKLGYAKYDELPSGSIKNAGYFVVQSDGTDFFLKETQGINKKEN